MKPCSHYLHKCLSDSRRCHGYFPHSPQKYAHSGESPYDAREFSRYRISCPRRLVVSFVKRSPSHTFLYRECPDWVSRLFVISIFNKPDTSQNPIVNQRSAKHYCADLGTHRFLTKSHFSLAGYSQSTICLSCLGSPSQNQISFLIPFPLTTPNRVSCMLQCHWIFELRQVHLTDNTTTLGSASSVRFATRIIGNVGAPLRHPGLTIETDSVDEEETIIYSSDPLSAMSVPETPVVSRLLPKRYEKLRHTIASW